MKSTKTLMCAMAVGAMIFAAGKASAVLGVFNVSGVAYGNSNNIVTNSIVSPDVPGTGVYKEKIIKHAFYTKTVLKLLANATGNGWFTNKASRLVYDPDAYNEAATAWYNDQFEYDDDVYGIFYVTNTTSHDVYRLDGYDEEESYYSYVEFDSYDWELGFWDNAALGENYARSYVENDNKNTYSSMDRTFGLLYIHDDPYDFDIADYPYGIFDENDNAFIIRGLGVFKYGYNSTDETESFHLRGSGDGYFLDSYESYPAIKGIVTFKGKGQREGG
jgi:hypothetical protein